MMAGTGELLYYKCMTPKYLEKFVDRLIEGGSDDIELKIQASGTEYKRLFTVPLLGRNFGRRDERDNLTILINVAAEGPKPSYYDPLSVCISDGRDVMGVQLRDPSEYHKEGFGPYMSMYGRDGFNLSEVINKASTEHETNFKHGDWLRWPQMFNIRIKPNPGQDQPWGLCSSSVNGGVSLSFTYPRTLDVNNELSLNVFRYKPSESYTINMIEVAIYKDAKDERH